MGRSESPLTTGAHSPSHHHHHVAEDADHEEDISRKQKPRPLYACRGFRLLGRKEGDNVRSCYRATMKVVRKVCMFTSRTTR